MPAPPRHSVSAEASSYPRLDTRDNNPAPRSRSQSHPHSPIVQRRQAFHDARTKFQSLRKDYERTAADGRTFVLVSQLTAKLRRTGVMDEMRESTNDVVNPGGTPSVTKDGPPEYTIVFYILVETGVPELFRVFRNHGVDDAQLPLSKHRLEHLVRQQDRRLTGFVQRFLAEQVAWCPIRFSSGMSLDQRNRIEPFCHQSPIRSSRGTRPFPANNANVFEVHISENVLPEDTCCTLDELGSCIALNTKPEMEITGEPADNDGKCYRVALKRFPSNKRNTFEREKSAFEYLRQQNGLIQYIASYQTTNDKQETHYNILLEFAEIDLYQVIHKEEPPVSPDKIKAFWEAMLGVCRGLQAIRTIHVDDAPFHVWHCDVKPENILRTGGRFKLADLGETRILRSDPDGQPQAIITGGTMTYAAPEKAAYLDSRVQRPSLVNQNSDVWSLGAVLSNAATFVVLGKQGVLKYNLVRSGAVKKATGKGGDGFHDGERVLEAVKQWHVYLRDCSRRHDDMTPAILDLVDQGMLVDSEDRWNSATTADRLEYILDNTADGHRRAPRLIEEMLDEIEDDPVSFRERSMESTVTSLGIFPAGDTAAADDAISTSKFDLLNQEILPTAPQGVRRRNTARSFDTGTSFPATTRAGPPVPNISTNFTNSEFFEPYTVFKLRESLDEFEKEAKSKGGMFGGRGSFIRRRKASVKGGGWKEDYLEDAFQGRDIIFLVDNGSTMAVQWQEATELLTTLVRRAIGYDDDGIELYFTSQENMKHSAVVLPKQRVEDFTHAMSQWRPANQGYLPQGTNIVPSLSKVMGKYQSEQKKPKTIIVLTDGIWQGLSDEYAVDNLIINNLKSLRTIHPNTAACGNVSMIESIRPLTIQFVRFGQNPHGSDRLRRLDDCLGEQGVEDMVDCEPSGGDVYKMFLGSLLKEMDMRLNIFNILSPSSPSLSRVPSVRNGNVSADDEDNDEESAK